MDTDEKIESPTQDLITDGKNKDTLICPRCPSIILSPQMADYKEIEHSLPLMTLRKDRKDDRIEVENVHQFWEVADKFSFENIGFSNTVSGMKYLTCADCEIGPIGWFDPVSQQSYSDIGVVQSMTFDLAEVEIRL